MTDIISGDQPDNSGVNPLETLVGEGKKYASVEVLAESRIKADEHISTLETENKNMLEKLAALEEAQKEAATLSSVLEAINNKTPGQEANNQGASNPEDLREMVGSVLSQKEAEQAANSNRLTVNDALLKAFNGDGTKAKEFYEKKVAANRLTPDTFKTLSEQSPDAALNLLGITKSPQGTVSPSNFSDINTDAGAVPNRQNYEYYSNLRKEMGVTKYYANTKLVQEELQASAKPDFYK